MPTDFTPIAVRAATAAKMLDMPVERFRSYVEAGALPGPVKIGRDERWRVDQLQAILRGDAALPQDFEL